jgi:hypothetical protein
VFRRALPVVFVATLALLASACGGGGGATAPVLGASGAAEIPASAAVVVAVDTSFDSPATSELKVLLDRFPAKDRLYEAIRQRLAKEGLDFDADIRPAFGPETDLVVLDLESEDGEPSYVLLTKPEDPAKLDALLAKADEPIAHEVVDGWTVASDSAEAIAAFKQAASAGTLVSSETYGEATSELPDDALATLYVNGAPVTAALARAGLTSIPTFGRLSWASGALQAQDDGVSLEFHAKGDDVQIHRYSPQLPNVAPHGALAFLSFANVGAAIDALAAQPDLLGRNGALGGVVGAGPLRDLAGILRGEGALYVRPGAELPEVTALLDEADPAGALRTMDRLAGVVAAFTDTSPTETRVGGVAAKRVALGEYGLYYAAVGGRLVVTDTEGGITGLRPLGPKFSSDPVFKSAQDAAGMPDETTGFLFVNLRDTIPLIERLGANSIPPEVADNLKPLQSLLAYGTVDGDTVSARLFVQVS